MDILNNTKTLPSSFKIPKIVKILGKIMQTISYKLTSWITLKLFITPTNYPTPNREKIMYNSAQKTMLAIPTIQKKVHILTYGFSKKKVLLVHGWSGRSTQFYLLADMLLEKGYMVVSFDAPAHGKSTGKTTILTEFMETIKVVHNQLGPFEATVGHSLGAMALVNVAAKEKISNKLVSIGAADLVSDVIRRFISNFELKPIIADQMQQRIEQKWKVKIDDYATSTTAKKINIPTLVVHDSSDGDVPVSCANKIRLNLHKGKLLITAGLGHTRILKDKHTMRYIVKFITKN